MIKMYDGQPANINVQLDGNSWFASQEGFINLQESPAGFGDTPQEAVEDLLKKLA